MLVSENYCYDDTWEKVSESLQKWITVYSSKGFSWILSGPSWVFHSLHEIKHPPGGKKNGLL